MSELDFSLFDIIPHGVCIINKNCEVLFWNKTLEEWTGVKKKQIFGREIDFFFHHLKQPQYKPLIQKKVFEDSMPLIFSALLHKYFFYSICKDNHFRKQHTTITPFTSDKGVQRAIIFVQDVTELYSQMNEMKKLKDEAIFEAQQSKIAKEQIKSLLTEKDILLKEVHHRIKNNMYAMRGLMLLQADMLNDPVAISVLNDASSRMHSMGILYDKLYRTENIEGFSISDYLPALVDEILDNFSTGVVIKTEKNIEDFVLDVRRLQPLGIIINELLTNSMKYAFKNRTDGLITIEAILKPEFKDDNQLISISIHDNGIGLPESIDFENATGFGLSLVKMLTEQLNGTIKIERNNGTKFTLEFF